MPGDKSAHAEDLIVSANLRRIRVVRQITQQGLAAALGVSFEQLQKYEKGMNRISAGRLIQLSRALNCRLGDLFDGTDGDAPDRLATAPLSLGAHRLASLFESVESPVVKRKIIALVAATVGEDDATIEAEEWRPRRRFAA